VRATILPGGHAVSDLRRLIAYFRLDPEGRLLMGGRGGLDGNLSRRRFGHVIARLKQILPQVGEMEPEFFWNGRVALTLDHVPHVHAPAPGLWIAHGWNGRGVAAATALGKTMADLVCGMDRADCALPFTEVAPIPFHGARLPAMKAMVWWKQFSDWVETSRSRH